MRKVSDLKERAEFEVAYLATLSGPVRRAIQENGGLMRTKGGRFLNGGIEVEYDGWKLHAETTRALPEQKTSVFEQSVGGDCAGTADRAGVEDEDKALHSQILPFFNSGTEL